MIVGICRLVLHLPDNRSLKGKRQIIRKICEKLRNKYPISIAEVGNQNDHRKSQIGIALVGSSYRVVYSTLQEIYDAAENLHLAPIIDRDFEIINYNDAHPPGAEGNYSPDGWDEEEGTPEEALPWENPWDYLEDWKLKK